MTRDKLTVVLGALLFLSLSVNFFMGGIVLGDRMRGKPADHIAAKDAEFRKSLTEADRKVIEGVMQDNRAKFEKFRNALEAARKEVKDAAHAEPFDQDDLDDALGQEQGAKIDILRHRELVRQQVMQGLSDDGRKALEKLAPPVRRAPRQSDDDMPFIWEDAFLYGID